MVELTTLPAPDKTSTATKGDLGEWIEYMGLGAAQLLGAALDVCNGDDELIDAVRWGSPQCRLERVANAT